MKPEPQYRYPGLEPFSSAQRELFFGRASDLNRLLEMVQTHQQVLLYAKSGLGKSSLINAGLVPSLMASAGAQIIPIRIGAYLDGQSTTPLEAVRGALPKVESTLLDRIIHQEGSLWYNLKADSLLTATPKIYYSSFAPPPMLKFRAVRPSIWAWAAIAGLQKKSDMPLIDIMLPDPAVLGAPSGW